MPELETPSVDTDPFKLASIGNLELLQKLVCPETDETDGTDEPIIDVNAIDAYGCTALLWAARAGSLPVFDFLIEQGSNIEVAGYGGMRCLHHVVNSTKEDILKRLLELDADVHAVDDAGNSAMHYAAARGFLNPLIAILSAGGEVNLTNGQEATPLHKAVTGGHVSCVHLLLQKTADPNKMDADGNNALHLASRAGFKSIVHTLLEKGGAKEIKNKFDQRPVDLAFNESIAVLLT